MSRRNKHNRQQRGILGWPIIAVGAVLVAAAGLFLAQQGGGGGSDAGGTPQIAVDQQKIDYGYVQFGQTRSFKIAVTNDGDGPLRFKSKPYVEVLEGC